MKAAALAALLACPAGPGARGPRLSPAPGGLLLSWLEPADKGSALKLSRWDGTAWSAARVVASGKLLVNGSDFPAVVALEEGGYAAQWTAPVAGGEEASAIFISTSADGAAWSAPRPLHRDASTTEHGFATLTPLPGGGFAAVWLDGRAKAGGGGAQALYAARWEKGALGPEHAVDARVCDCCSTAAAATGAGLLVAYRDRASNETRDVSVVSLASGAWSAPRPVTRDGWVINGCPVNGPALAARGERVVLAWYTAAADRPQVKAAFSADGGGTFGRAARLDAGAPAGRVDAVLLDDGSAVVTWLEDGALRGRRVAPDGRPDAPFVIARGKIAGVPRLGRWGGRVLAAWTDVSAARSRVRLAAFDPEGPARPASGYQIALGEDGWEFRFLETGEVLRMLPVRFDGKNSDEIDIQGLGVRGERAHILMSPILDRNKNPIAIPFAEVRLDLKGLGFESPQVVSDPEGLYVVLDRARYRSRRVRVSRDLAYTLYSSTSAVPNPDVETIRETFGFYAKTFPAKARRLAPPLVVTLLNQDEKFDDLPPTWKTGLHVGRMVLLTSHDGTGARVHRLHEIGGLFKIDSLYAHSLSWFIAYDQELKAAAASQRPALVCKRLVKQLDYLLRTPEADRGRPIDWFIQDHVKRDGYSLYAWGAAYYWLEINSALEKSGRPDLYQLIDRVHRAESRGAAAGPSDALARLTAQYAAAFGESADLSARANSIFKETPVSAHIDAARRALDELKCPR